ncbi:hypothetical protein DPMN_100401 [Dreissena polymorpha]|uniref:Uncharacterized protein n=1 Tax=Dreissena polymorpha TaxID=45954 RepID=A0A9D4LJ63_DREPO|nr:hypothetical protein DPMN_100401 [Dreissena polymorpha]
MNDIRARIEPVNDLPAADALYHQTCSSYFRTGKDIQEEFRVQPSKDTEASDAFLKVMTFFKDNDDEQVTIKQLQDQMYDGDNAVVRRRQCDNAIANTAIFSSITKPI